MKLHQLRYICQVAKSDLNVSEAAQALHTSQPGVSKQIRLLEQELGVPVFVRTGKSLSEVSPPGREILRHAQRVLNEVDMIQRIGDEHSRTTEGTLTVATTHTQACYALPKVISDFLGKYPKVQLRIRQGSPQQIADMVAAGEADLGIATEAVSGAESLIALPCYRWNRCVVVLPDHPLLQKQEPVTLADLAQYPIITYDFAFAGQTLVSEAFAQAHLTPNLVITALDSDVIKTYVKAGLGIGLLAKMAYDPEQDGGLEMIDVAHLFEANTTWVGIKRGSYLRGFVFDFIELFAPHLNRSTVKAAIHVE
jgi:LysR family cys regulon transcriptional activator